MGTITMKRFAAAFAAVALAGLAGCAKKEAPPAPEGAGKPPVAVEVAAAAPVDFTSSVEAVGTLSPKFETTVRAEIKSRVAQVFVTQWVAVSPGQPLLQSDTTDLEAALAGAKAAQAAARSQEEAARSQGATAQAQVETLKAQVEAARAQEVEAQVGQVRGEREHARVANLAESGLATRQALDEAGSARDASRARVSAAQAAIRAAESQVRAAEAQVSAAIASASAAASQAAAAGAEIRRVESALTKATIRSPLRGVVAERMVNVGDMPGDSPLFKLVDNSVMNLTLSIPMKEQAAVRVGQGIDFTTDALPGETFRGTLLFVKPVVSGSDRSVEAVAEIPNPDGRLKGGFFARARIVTGEERGALALPRQAFASRDVAAGSGEIFVVSGDVAKKRKVRTGETQGEMVRLLGGVSAGEKVIVRGGFSVKDGDRVTVPAGGAK